MRSVVYSDGRATRIAWLAPVTGADEAALEGLDGATVALELLRRVVREPDGSATRVEELTVSAVDRLLVAIHGDLYDDTAECRLACAACDEEYQFVLDLAAMIAAQDAERPGPAAADGAWELADGRRVRAPTLADVTAATDARDLLARALVGGELAGDDDPELEDFLERAAPVMSLDLDVDCPNCGAHETVRFDLAHHLGARLSFERAFLVRETHLIASRYGWSLTEIMSLSQRTRRAYASLIEAERSARRAG